MKNIILALSMVLLLALNLVAMPPRGPVAKPASTSATATVDNTTYINANNILMLEGSVKVIEDILGQEN